MPEFHIAQKAAPFVCPEAGWRLGWEEGVRRINSMLDTALAADKGGLQQLATRGAEWCQMLHRATVPERVVDMHDVYCHADLEREEALHNYAVLKAALDSIGARCHGHPADQEGDEPLLLLGPERVEKLLGGDMGATLDIMCWMVALCDHLGAPEFYYPAEERAEAMAAKPPLAKVRAAEKERREEEERKQRQQQQQQQQQQGRRPQLPPRGAPPRMTTARATPGRPTAAVRPTAAAVRPTAAAVRRTASTAALGGVPEAKRMRAEAPRPFATPARGGAPPRPQRSIPAPATPPRGLAERRAPNTPGSAANAKLRQDAAQWRSKAEALQDKLTASEAEVRQLQQWKGACATLSRRADQMCNSIRSALADVDGMTAEEVRSAVLARLVLR